MTDLSITHTAAYGVQAYALAGARAQGQGKTAPRQQDSPPASGLSGDQVSLSGEGKELNASQEAAKSSQQEDQAPTETRRPATKDSDRRALNEEEIRQIEQLKSRDTEVRTHEQAHLSAAGQYAAGGPSFSYQTGADGKRYVVGGSVPIDTGKESTPAATIMKMRTVKRAALAPASPSPADRQIASQASMQEMAAMQELQTIQLTGSLDGPSGPAVGKGSEAPGNPDKNNVQKDQDPLSTIKESSATTRTMMSAAYKAMAALA